MPGRSRIGGRTSVCQHRINMQGKRGSVSKVSVALDASVMDVPFTWEVRIQLVLLERYGDRRGHELGRLTRASSSNHRVFCIVVAEGRLGRCRCGEKGSSAAYGCGADLTMYTVAAGGGGGGGMVLAKRVGGA
jgi:hypothetical protein